MQFIPHDYQKRAIERVVRQKSLGLFFGMGLGKTVITLTAIYELLYDRFEVSKVLVIAPKRVAEDTWTREHEKWDHLKGLEIARVLGSEVKRKRALKERADVFVIGRDNVAWLVDYYCKKRSWPFDMIVIDELSGFKNPQAKRFRALRKVLTVTSRVLGLTGTPSPKGLMDLWAQIYLLDKGKRLGKTIGAYRELYFRPGAHNGYVVYKWEPKKGAKKEIEEKISDICVSMSAEDYLSLPDRMDNRIYVKLSDREMQLYKQMEEAQLVRIEGADIVALNAAAIMTKLLQMANGRVYDTGGGVIDIHRAKLEALKEIIETAGSPVLVFYSYKHDLEKLLEEIKGAKALEGQEDIRLWNGGKIEVLLAHPASVGYGLNLQDGGHIIVWYGLTWSLELYQQANARLHRQGQKEPVIIYHLLAEGTADEQVMKALEAKDTSQAALLAALKERSIQ